MPNLKKMGYGKLDNLKTPDKFWKDYDAQKAKQKK